MYICVYISSLLYICKISILYIIAYFEKERVWFGESLPHLVLSKLFWALSPHRPVSWAESAADTKVWKYVVRPDVLPKVSQPKENTLNGPYMLSACLCYSKTESGVLDKARKIIFSPL